MRDGSSRLNKIIENLYPLVLNTQKKLEEFL